MEARILEWREIAREKETHKRKLEKINHLMQCVPPRFRGKQFSDFTVEYEKQSKVKTVAERFVSSFSERLMTSTNLHFIGVPGTGKTFLSLIMSQALINLGFSVDYKSSLQFVRQLIEKRYTSEAGTCQGK